MQGMGEFNFFVASDWWDGMQFKFWLSVISTDPVKRIYTHLGRSFMSSFRVLLLNPCNISRRSLTRAELVVVSDLRFNEIGHLKAHGAWPSRPRNLTS